MNKDLKDAANKKKQINVAVTDQSDSSVFSHPSSKPLHIGKRSRKGDQTSLIPGSFASVSSYGSLDDEEMFDKLSPTFEK